ncbi:DUF2442 domain-containing protein [Treponema sp.]
MLYDVVNVEPLDHLLLKVEFSDGTMGEVRFEETHLKGVFAALKDREYFSLVNCANGFVEWPDNLDLAPDAMYDAVKESGVWVLT